MKQYIFAIMFLVLAVSTAVAEPMPESDIPVRYTSWHISYDVNKDGSYVETQRWSATILKENAVEREKRASVTFSTSVAKGEILEAYTLKKNGQRIDTPKNSYQVTINDGYEKASPLFSDETTISVVFPELAVGDSVVFAARVTNSEGIFPSEFSTAHSFSRYAAYDDVSITLSAPADMDLKWKSYFLTEQKPVRQGAKQTLRWTYQNKIPEKWNPSDSGIENVGDSPSLFVSSFRNYQSIVDAYGRRATPKAAVTDRVKQLASEIVADVKPPDLQARAIYEWVAKNISYGGNCIGIGAVVPRDLSVVLDNRMGDCKDHATLLQSLLAARNIESEQALINAGMLYQLPDVPVVSAVNHVINYLPAMNLFLDSTSSETPFGMLPLNLGEKPVLLVSHYREGTKTPSTALYGHGQTMRTKVTVRPDGSASGDAEVKLKGVPAVAARALMRVVPGGQEEYVVKKMLESQGMHGTGTLKKDDPEPLMDTYNLSIAFDVEEFVTVGTAAGMAIKPLVVSFFPIDGFLINAYQPLPNKKHVCGGGMSIEEYVLEFPETVKIASVPKNFELTGKVIDYTAKYQKNANTLTIRRELKDKTASNVCSPEHAAEFKKDMLLVAKDLKSQILLSD